MKGDASSVKNRTMTMGSYNRQLLRNANLFSRVMGDVVRYQEKQSALISESPKDNTLVDVIKLNWQLAAKVDGAAALLLKLEAENVNKVNYIEEMAKRQRENRAGGSLKSDRFVSDETKLAEAAERMGAAQKQFMRSMDSDKLTIFIKESASMRERNLEQLVKSGEEKSELYLEKHIRQQMRGRNKKLSERLTDDDFFDWVLLGALVVVALFGLLMWRKLKEQQTVLL